MATKTDSKSNLNESTLPLLDDEANKEKIELKSKDEPDASKKETAEAEAAKAAKEAEAEEAKRKKEEEKEKKRQLKLEEEEKKKQAKLEKQKKKEEEREAKKKEKEEKKKAEAEKKAANGGPGGEGPSGGDRPWCSYNQFTVGINLLDRDERSVNEHVNVNFEDIIGEPDAAQGFDGAYRLSYGTFQFVRFWFYRILMTVLSVPLALVWGVAFAVLSVLSVWVLTPAFRVVDIAFYFVHRIWNALIRTVLDPIFSSIALVRLDRAKSFHRTPVATCTGRSIYRDGVKYQKVETGEGSATYKKSDSDDDVTDKQITLNIENI